MNLHIDPRIAERLLRLDRRVLHFAMAGALAVAVLEGWQWVLRTPAGEYRQLLAARHEAERTLHGIAALPQDLVRVRANVQQLESSLAQGPGTDLTAGAQSALLIGELDHLARLHHVTLLGVKPGTSGHTQGFVSSSQDVEARGRYADLMEWLPRIEQSLGPLVVSRFKLSSRAAEDPELSLQFSITAYRLGDAKEAQP